MSNSDESQSDTSHKTGEPVADQNPLDVKAKPQAKRSLPGWARQIIVYGFVLVIIFALQFAANVRADNMKKEGIEKGADAVAATLPDLILKPDPARLQLTVQRLAKLGGYDSVTIADPTGKVLASTDRQKDATTIKDLSDPNLKSTNSNEQGRLVMRRPISIGEGNNIGAIEIQLTP